MRPQFSEPPHPKRADSFLLAASQPISKRRNAVRSPGTCDNGWVLEDLGFRTSRVLGLGLKDWAAGALEGLGVLPPGD